MNDSEVCVCGYVCVCVCPRDITTVCVRLFGAGSAGSTLEVFHHRTAPVSSRD